MMVKRCARHPFYVVLRIFQCGHSVHVVVEGSSVVVRIIAAR